MKGIYLQKTFGIATLQRSICSFQLSQYNFQVVILFVFDFLFYYLFVGCGWGTLISSLSLFLLLLQMFLCQLLARSYENWQILASNVQLLLCNNLCNNFFGFSLFLISIVWSFTKSYLLLFCNSEQDRISFHHRSPFLFYQQ